MPTWGAVVWGVVASGVLAVVLFFLVLRVRARGTLAAAAVAAMLGPLRAATGARTAWASLLCGLAALVVDIYLY